MKFKAKHAIKINSEKEDGVKDGTEILIIGEILVVHENQSMFLYFNEDKKLPVFISSLKLEFTNKESTIEITNKKALNFLNNYKEMLVEKLELWNG